MKTVTFNTSGMSCHHCEDRLTKALMALNGVTSCSAVAASGVVECQFDENVTTESAVAQVIDDTGFDIVK